MENKFVDISNNITVLPDSNNSNNSNNSENSKNCNFNECNRRIKITDLKCRCNKYFCSRHSFPEDHKCDYDYKEPNKKQKKIDELKCVSTKVQKLN